MFKSYIDPEERAEANRSLPRLMGEGLLLGGTGLGVLALIFEIAADAFSVAAYQTLLAIHGAEGHHQIAILAFIVLSALLLLGIVPAYKAGAYLRPNAGGSGPLVEAIGPPRMRWLSWIGTSLFFLDAILTIIISSISAADVTMLIAPELADYRILLAEIYAFFIMAILVALGPKKAVPIFLIGGGAFTLFTIGALSLVGFAAMGNPEWAFMSDGIISRLEANGVVEHVVRAQEDFRALGTVVFFQFFFRSMSSAMLGFSGYEVIPASGKHAARPKWKVINTALTLAAFFLIGTGVIQLYAAQQWNIPATEGYSTLLIEYEIVAAQTLGRGVERDTINVTQNDVDAAEELFERLESGEVIGDFLGEEEEVGSSRSVEELSFDIATVRAINDAMRNTAGARFLLIAGILLAIILLLAQGGGYVGGAAVAANAARLGRLPALFEDDRNGIAVIWGISAILIPIIREVVIVEAYYAFGFVSAFIITSTTVYFVREGALRDRGIDPDSSEAKSLRFAGLRGMIASYFMGVVLITQKTDALFVIAVAGAAITLFQIYVAHRTLTPGSDDVTKPQPPSGSGVPHYETGIERALDEARQRGIVAATENLIAEGELANRFNVGPDRMRQVVSYLYNVKPSLFTSAWSNHPEDIEEPSELLQEAYEAGLALQEKIEEDFEYYNNFGIFTFVHNYHLNWVDEAHGRTKEVVEQAMLDILFPAKEHNEIWEEFQQYEFTRLPEPLWQFARRRYMWAKDQWPNLSDRITTIWTLQEFGLISDDVDIRTVVSVANGRAHKLVKISTSKTKSDQTEKETLEDE